MDIIPFYAKKTMGKRGLAIHLFLWTRLPNRFVTGDSVKILGKEIQSANTKSNAANYGRSMVNKGYAIVVGKEKSTTAGRRKFVYEKIPNTSPHVAIAAGAKNIADLESKI